VAPYELDARRCISYLTIEHHGSIAEELRPLIGNRVYGCDDCQLACPWNKFAPVTGEADFHAVRNGLDRATLVELFAWTRDEFDARLAGSAIRRIGYERWLRNVAVGLGNAPRSDEVVAALRARAGRSVAPGARARGVGAGAPRLARRYAAASTFFRKATNFALS
jgi:epoxyqueuosine reductase